MKRTTQSHPRLQSLLLVAIATIMMLAASAATFAQNIANNNRFALDSLFSSAANQNLWLNNSSPAFAFATAEPNPTAMQDTSKYPKPDTTEMDNWFEVVKYDYNILRGELWFTLKAKADWKDRPHWWNVNFYDADGVQVISEWRLVELSAAPAGKVERAWSMSPSEKQMQRVKTVVVTRIVE